MNKKLLAVTKRKPWSTKDRPVCKTCDDYRSVLGPCPEGRNCAVAHWINCPECTP